MAAKFYSYFLILSSQQGVDKTTISIADEGVKTPKH